MSQVKLKIIGDENAVFGFALLGVEGEIVHTPAEARQALQEALAAEGIGIVLLTEEWAEALRAEVDQLKATSSEPLILEIPASQPRAEHASLRDLVQTALGIRLDY